MQNPSNEILANDKLEHLKRVAATVYLCQLLTFTLAGLPLLLAAAINFYKRNEVKGTWLESHFNWQIKTTWVVIAGFALAGVTFSMAFGIVILVATVAWMIYRIAVGWYALTDQKPIDENMA